MRKSLAVIGIVTLALIFSAIGAIFFIKSAYSQGKERPAALLEERPSNEFIYYIDGRISAFNKRLRKMGRTTRFKLAKLEDLKSDILKTRKRIQKFMAENPGMNLSDRLRQVESALERAGQMEENLAREREDFIKIDLKMTPAGEFVGYQETVTVEGDVLTTTVYDEMKFDSKGNILSYEMTKIGQNGKVIEKKRVENSEFDVLGVPKFTKVSMLNHKGEVVRYKEIENLITDKEGRVLEARVKNYDADGTYLGVKQKLYTYDERGRLIKDVEIVSGPKGKYVSQIVRENLEFDGRGNVLRSNITVYDEARRIVEKKERYNIYDTRGNLVRYAEIMMDENGNVIDTVEEEIIAENF